MNLTAVSSALTFNDLRAANIKRLPQFRNRLGAVAHSKPDGSDWSLNDWMTALTGEVGETANLLKKVRRGDITLEKARPALLREIADIQIYLDILAMQCGVDLGLATVTKFNETSENIGVDVQLTREGFVAVLPETLCAKLTKWLFKGY